MSTTRQYLRSTVTVLLTLVTVVAASSSFGATAAPAPKPNIATAAELCVRVVAKGDTSRPPTTCGNTAARGTPDGYVLKGVKQTPALYFSSAEEYQLYNPQDQTLYCSVYVQLVQELDPATPKYWDLTGDMQQRTDVPCVTSWSADYLYNCGVNIRNASDPTCTEYKNQYYPTNPNSPDPTSTGAFNPGQTIIRYMGFETGVTKFPLMKFGILFSTPQGPRYQDFKFRGYDTCVRPTSTFLCDRSDTGA